MIALLSFDLGTSGRVGLSSLVLCLPFARFVPVSAENRKLVAAIREGTRAWRKQGPSLGPWFLLLLGVLIGLFFSL